MTREWPLFLDNGSSFWLDDCRKFLREMQDRPNMIFADPPFNFGEPYEHGDNMTHHEYRQFTREWLSVATDILMPGGALWVNVPDEHASAIDFITDSLGMVRINWIIWHYRFGQHTDHRFVRSKSHLFYFAKPPVENRVFNTFDIRVESVREQIGDLRAEPSGRTPMDVWGFEKFWGRVQGNNRERVPEAPNQLPEKLLERVILATTYEGDLIADPFCGSGTTSVVGGALKRVVATADLSQRALVAAHARAERGSVRV